MESSSFIMQCLQNIIENSNDKDTKYLHVNDEFSFDIIFPDAIDNETKPYELKLIRWQNGLADTGCAVRNFSHDKFDYVYKIFIEQCTHYINHFLEKNDNL